MFRRELKILQKKHIQSSSIYPNTVKVRACTWTRRWKEMVKVLFMGRCKLHWIQRNLQDSFNPWIYISHKIAQKFQNSLHWVIKYTKYVISRRGSMLPKSLFKCGILFNGVESPHFITETYFLNICFSVSKYLSAVMNSSQQNGGSKNFGSLVCWNVDG